MLFAQEGRGRVLLALEALSKKTQRTPPEAIRLAERRLADWRARAQGGTKPDEVCSIRPESDDER